MCIFSYWIDYVSPGCIIVHLPLTTVGVCLDRVGGGQARYQSFITIEEKIEQALLDNEIKHKQRQKELELKIERIESQNRQMQVTIESVLPELRGTSAEIVLFDHLSNAFPKDEIISKKVGVEMGDIIQTIVMENDQRITPPIVWDSKLVQEVKREHIEKAKKYKTVHNTDFSIIVTARGITNKDSDNSLIGTREGVLLVHVSIVVEIAELHY